MSHRDVPPDPLSPLLPARTPGSLGRNDAASPGATAERGDTPGSLGYRDLAETLAFRGLGDPSETQLVAKRFKRRGLAELNIVGTFADKANWKSDEELLEATKRDSFFPRTKELLLCAQSYGKRKRIKVTQVRDFVGVLCAIVYDRPKRINVFTHGTSLSGEVVRGNVYFATGRFVDIDGVAADATLESSGFQCGGKGTSYRSKAVTLSKVRKSLPKNAEMILYGCKSGSSRKQLARIAKLLKIRLSGFTKEIRYHPVSKQKGGRSKIVDWKYSAGSGPKFSGYHKLKPDVSVAP